MRRGFTLVEVMLAIFFIAIAIFALVSLQLRLMYSTFKLEVHQMRCETTTSALVDEVVSTQSNPTPLVGDPNLPTGLKSCTQGATWTDRNGRHTFTIQTYVRQQARGW